LWEKVADSGSALHLPEVLRSFGYFPAILPGLPPLQKRFLTLMFYGETRVSIDEKGRLAIPTEHRAQISAFCANRLVVAYNPYEAECLWIFPKPSWEQVRDQVMRLSSAKAAHREFQRRLVGAAAQLELDASARIVLPHAARAQGNFGKSAILLGMGEKFELWSEAAYSARMQPIAEQDVTTEMLELNF
jgi:MraZ protein